MKKAIALLLCLVMVISLGACGKKAEPQAAEPQAAAPAAEAPKQEESKNEEPKKEEVITLGVLAPLTGNNAEYGTGFQVATQMAVDEINGNGGINGYRLALVLKDSQGDSTVSSDLCRQFCDDESIYAIIGDFTSGACMANAPIVDEAGIVQLSPTASNTEYAKMSPYCFSIMGRQDGEAPFFAENILKGHLGLNNISVLYINSDWGLSAFTNFEAKAKEIGLEIKEALTFVGGETDFAATIAKLKASDPEALCIMGQGDVALIINQIKASGWDVPLTTLGPGPSQQLLDNCGENAEGLVGDLGFYFNPDDPEITAWKNTFVEKTGFNPTTHPVCAYDCVYLIAEAIKMCGDGEVTRDSIRDNLAKVEYPGMAGDVKFTENGDIYRHYHIAQVVNGEWKIVVW